MRFKARAFSLSNLLILGIVGQILPAQAATYYVSPTGGTSDGTTPATALQWQIASNKANANPATHDTIIFLPGRYDRTNVGATGRDDCLLAIPSNVTVKAQSTAPGSRSVLTGVMVSRKGIMIQSPIYQFIVVDGRTTDKTDVIIEGFEIENLALNEVANEAAGIVLVDDCHRIQILNNLVHDLGNGGMGSYQFGSAQSGIKLGSPGGADYLTFRGNTIYNTCRWFTGGGGASGLSLLGLSNTGPLDEDGRTTHNFIQGNTIYNNRTSQTGSAADRLTDNNGIIIDLGGSWDPDSSQNPRRQARVLIENNLVYGNDGRGIHVFKSSNVLVRNNTCYQNLQLAKFTGEGELSAAFCKDVLFVNNVAYADGTNRPINSLFTDGFKTGNGNVHFRSNTTGNGTNVYSKGVTQSNNTEGLTAAHFTPDGRNKVLPPYTIGAQKTIDVGSAGTSDFPHNNDFAPTDIEGNRRPGGARVDRGAFETSVKTGRKAPRNLNAASADGS